MNRLLLIATIGLAGCVVQGGKDVPPVKAAAGSGVTVDAETQEVGLDTTKVPQVPSCAEGQFVKRAGAGWECVTIGAGGIDTSKTPLVNSCPTGQVVRKTAEGWDCTPLPEGATVIADVNTGLTMTGSTIGIDNTKVPRVEACAEGQVVAKATSGWVCQDAGPTLAQVSSAVAGLRPASACGSGEVSKWNGTGWECVAAGGSAGEMRVFDASGDFVVPAGVNRVFVELWGGGDGGRLPSGSSNPGIAPGSGGAGGNYQAGFVTVTPLATYRVTIGRGGAAGQPGGATTFADQLSSTTQRIGGNSVFIVGQPGRTATIRMNEGTIGFGGDGGDAARGGSGGRGGIDSGDAALLNGGNGVAPGGGGGGGAITNNIGTSGSGADGRLILLW